MHIYYAYILCIYIYIYIYIYISESIKKIITNKSIRQFLKLSAVDVDVYSIWLNHFRPE